MSSKTFIFIGRSGVGKGTQVLFLKKYLKKKYPEYAVLDYATGDGVRKITKEYKYTAQRLQKIYDGGGLFPEFLTVYGWSHYFVSHINGKEHVILDGTPRKLHEAKMLDTAFEFYDKKEVYIIFMRGTRDWSTKLLSGRGRSDDTSENIRRRLDWFEKDVTDTIAYYKKHKTHTFLEINAEQAREDVHKEIISKLGI